MMDVFSRKYGHGYYSGRWRRYALVLTLFITGLALFFILSITLGSVNIPLTDTLKIIFSPEKIDYTHDIIWQIRMPRALGALISGAALAVSGLLLQVFFRNPIVGPHILGITSGATLTVALVMMSSYLIGMTSVSPITLSLASFLGAMTVMAIIIAVAGKVRDIITLLVIGLMAGYIASALSSFLIAFAQSENVFRFVIWTMGSFSAMTWTKVQMLAGTGVVLMFGAFLMAKPLNAFLLGENYARSLGVNIKPFRYLVIFISGALAAIVTAFSGPVAFIGMAVPHLTRLALGTSDNRILIPAAIIGGAAVTLGCDLLARMLFSPVELPVSATTALFGAPLVIFFLIKGKTII